MTTTTEQRPRTDGGELRRGFDPHPGDPWHPDWTPHADFADEVALLEESQPEPTTAEETPTIETPPPSFTREDGDTGRSPSVPAKRPPDDLASPEKTPAVETPPPSFPKEDGDTGQTPSVPAEEPPADLISPDETPPVEAPPPSFPREDGDPGENLADWVTAAEAVDDVALLEESQTEPTTAEETPTIETPPPSFPREDGDPGERPSVATEQPPADLISPEEDHVASAEEALTISLPVSGTSDIAATDTTTTRPGTGLRERVQRARFPLGLLGLFVVYVTMALALSSVAPAVGLGWSSVVITSGSMSPPFNIGDVVVASPHDGRGLRVGTVVVFSDPARPGLVTHRIESVNPDGSYVTIGDANRQPDSTPLRPDQVVGVGRVLVPFIGLPLVWYWAGAWGKLAVWAAGTLLAVWLTRYALLQKYDPRAQPEENAHDPG